MNIVLIGYRGAGKTLVGKIIASYLGLNFIDTDDLITDREGKSVVEIFDRYGEEYFRDLEKKVTREIGSQDQLVIACGGGIITNWENIEKLKKNGIIIYLKASSQTIFKRIGKDQGRPPLTDQKGIKEIKYLLKKRIPLYEKAQDFSVKTDNKSAEEIAKFIIEYCKIHGSKRDKNKEKG